MLSENLHFSDSFGAKKHTDEDFINQSDKNYHLGITELQKNSSSRISFKCASRYMQLVCLGVMKKMIKLWIFGDKRIKAKKLHF